MELNPVLHKDKGTGSPSRSHRIHTRPMSGSTQKQTVANRIILLGAILTLGQLAEILHKSSRVFLFQQAQCLSYYTDLDPTKIQSGFRVDEALCKVGPVQSRLATIDGIDSFLSYLPPLLVFATYKELMPRLGLRRIVCLSLISTALGVLYCIIVFWLHRDWAIAAALLSSVFNLIGGGSIVRNVLVSKYIADISPPEQLTNSYNYISGFYFLANVGGSWTGSLLLSRHVYLLNGLSVACFALTAIVSAAIPSYCGREEPEENSTPLVPDQEDQYHNDSRTSPANNAVLSDDFSPKRQSSLLHILLNSWQKSYQSLLTLFSMPFPTSTIIFICLLNGLATKVEVLLPQYTSLLLSWPLATVNQAMALKNLVSAFFLFILPTLRRIYLEPRMSALQIDLFITQISLVVNALGVIGLGVSAPVWFFGLSLCVYTSGMGLADSLTSYGTFTLADGEDLAEFYVHFGLINTLAAFVGGPLWSTLFSVILRGDSLPLGLPFWMSGALFGAGIVGVTALRR